MILALLLHAIAASKCTRYSCKSDELCTQSGVCSKGLLGDACNPGYIECTGGRTCINKKCGNKLANGQKCRSPLDCISGRCTKGANAVCTSAKKEGEACKTYHDCDQNKSYKVACTSGKCARAVIRPNGAACNSDDQCESHCTKQGKCYGKVENTTKNCFENSNDKCTIHCQGAFATCPKGWKQEHQEVPGHVPACYCTRDYTTTEKAKARAKKCESYYSNCFSATGGDVSCQLAIDNCDDRSTLENLCTKSRCKNCGKAKCRK